MKPLWKYIGLKVDQEKKERYSQVEHELADVLIYLLHLANACNIDLFKAFHKKEYENHKRVWVRE
jgi:NTP pyrophosphatase (non-canonical NTP hydrolase)